MLAPRRENIHQNIQWTCLLLMAAGLPLSMFAMSVSTIFLFANWLTWGNPIHRVKLFLTNKAAWVFTLIFLMHVLGGLYSTDMDFYLDDLRMKLPLAVYPLVLGSTPGLNNKQYRITWLIFLLALITSTLISFCVYLGLTPVVVTDFRDISPFISHIRLSLLVCVAIAQLFLLLTTEKQSVFFKLLQLACILWLVYFLNLIESATGFAIVGVLFLAFALKNLFRIKNPALRYSLIASLIIIPMSWIGYFTWDYFSSKDPLIKEGLPEYSLVGKRYVHDFTISDTENGHYVFQFVSPDELDEQWPKRSHYPLDSSLYGGFALKARLLRYLASKNLPKDSIGLWTLSDEDIKAIEGGATNYRYPSGGISKRLYTSLQELDGYLNGSVNGSSLAQHVEYQKTGVRILKKHLLFGVGTGDLKLAFDQQYEIEHSLLMPEYRLRAHNQYLSILIGFGFIGFIVFAAALLVPVFVTKQTTNPFFWGFFIVACISFLSEDTLESQAGVSFFIFFYGLFIWAYPEKK